MSKGKKLNRQARQQLREVAPGPVRVAERMETLDAAIRWAERHGITVDIQNILEIAEYLGGYE